MSKKQWLVLLMLFLTYLLLGAFIFYHIEGHHEIEQNAQAKLERIEINALLHQHYMPGYIHDQHEILQKLTVYCGKSVYNYTEGEVDRQRWDFYNSFYFAYTVVSTIGYGNLAPTNTLSRILMIFYGLVGIPMNGILLTQLGQDNTKGSGPLFIMYKTFLICWISFGLGYIVMIMTFIARGMRSKKITRLEHKLAMNLKHTQSKIWNEFNKEVNYLRRVFNELQLSKVKRVYVDEYEYDTPLAKLARSNSFPDLRNLTIGGCMENYTPPHPRRRANSEVVPTDELTRVVSETDLQRIDKTATFAAHAMVQPAELLARLVNILGYIPPPMSSDDMNDWDQDEDQSTQVDPQNDQCKTVDSSTSTKQGLPKISQWRIGGERFPFTKPRSRATSEVRLHVTKNDFNVPQESSEWTWSGPAATKKLQELMKERNTTPLPASKDSNGKSYRFPSFALPISATKNFFPRWRRQSKKSVTGSNMKNTDKIVVEDNEKNSQQNSISPLHSYVDERRDSTAKKYYTHTGGNLSNYLEGNTLLEETSLADFLRALTALHARVGTVPDEYIEKPKRKLGTASLTPPKLPSLFTLFSSNSSGSGAQSNQNTVTGPQSYQSSRRVSLKTPESNYSGSNTPFFFRKESVAVKPRRFSLRPVATPVSPPTPPDYGSARLPNLHPLTLRIDERNLQEPYAPTEAFISVSPKEPLVNMEGPLGFSSPIKPPSNIRRFSIRPTQLSAQTSPTSPTMKPPPKWRAGILQRQLGQINLQRRVRAFSLSDVNTSKREKSPAPLSPLAMDNTNKFVDISRVNQKTVTIMSPAKEISMKNELRSAGVSASAASREEQVSLWNNRENVTSPINPFVLGLSDKSLAASNETMISRADSGRRCQGNRDHDNSTSSNENILQQRLVNVNDTLGRTVQTRIQEMNVDVKAGAPPATKEQSGVSACIIDNLNESQDSLNVTSSTSGCSESKREKPSVSIDFYKPSRQVIIERPAVNPFEQYRAMTRSGQKEDMDLKEIKIESPYAKRDKTEN
ncbi:uncharacterized protein LOC116845260 isoform X2 [Odontomachus brunneus]|uniref:uncharacterized protein LOC116845260 isoform X2 n=1 Tax=Odontomachus brunneus TaxID=486640 RepID=UPI0013F2913D|nr:uncharacterized protein LOC116845260 isoform X2 [Odontomachus brunneus]